jgi:hypothetical protein
VSKVTSLALLCFIDHLFLYTMSTLLDNGGRRLLSAQVLRNNHQFMEKQRLDHRRHFNLFLAFMLISAAMCWQDPLRSRAQIFKHEVDSFSRMVLGRMSPANRSNVVFVAFVHRNPIKKSFCFTLDYILNSTDTAGIDARYLAKIGSNYLLVNFENTSENQSIICEWPLEARNDLNFSKVVEVLFPIEDGGYLYRSRSFLYRNLKGRIDRQGFFPSDQMPVEFSIHRNFTHVTHIPERPE